MPLYPEHRTVGAALPVERVTSLEIDVGARHRRVEAFERKAHEQHPKREGPSFAQVLENKQKPSP